MTTGAVTHHRVHVAGIARDLPLVRVAPGLRIAVFNMLGDTEVVEACAAALAPALPADTETLVTAEAKSIPLAHALARLAGLPYVVLRKTWKPYMGEGPSRETRSMTTGAPQRLHLDAKDLPLVARKRVALVDDVVSTGSTLDAMRALMRDAGAEVAAELAVFSEGDAARWKSVTTLGHLPLFPDGA
jgi:adenine phosphoribosyltransferase